MSGGRLAVACAIALIAGAFSPLTVHATGDDDPPGVSAEDRAGVLAWFPDATDAQIAELVKERRQSHQETARLQADPPINGTEITRADEINPPQIATITDTRRVSRHMPCPSQASAPVVDPRAVPTTTQTRRRSKTDKVVGANIRAIRESLGLNRTQFADRLSKPGANINGSRIAAWETGKIRVTYEHLEVITKLGGVTPAFVYADHSNLEPRAVIEETPEFIITCWDERAEQLFGWTAAEAIGRSAYELMASGPPNVTAPKRAAQLERFGWVQIEATVGTKDRGPIRIQGIGEARRSTTGRVLGSVFRLYEVRA